MDQGAARQVEVPSRNAVLFLSLSGRGGETGEGAFP